MLVGQYPICIESCLGLRESVYDVVFKNYIGLRSDLVWPAGRTDWLEGETLDFAQICISLSCTDYEDLYWDLGGTTRFWDQNKEMT